MMTVFRIKGYRIKNFFVFLEKGIAKIGSLDTATGEKVGLGWDFFEIYESL